MLVKSSSDAEHVFGKSDPSVLITFALIKTIFLRISALGLEDSDSVTRQAVVVI